MALIRGLRGLRACPKCLIPSDALSDLSKDYPLRTTANTMQILKDVATQTREEREATLKDNGLRGIEVCCFQTYPNTRTC